MTKTYQLLRSRALPGITAAIAAVAACTRESTGPVALLSPSRLSIVTQPTNAVAGAAVGPAIAVAVLDSSGTVVSSAPMAIRLRIRAGTGTTRAHLRGYTEVATVDGIATFPTISIDSAGTGYRLSVSATGLPDTLSGTFDIAPAPPSRIAFLVQPSGVLAGATIAPGVTVVVLDSLGNRVTASTGTISLSLSSNPGSGALTGTATRSVISGQASFDDLAISQSGDGYAIQAAASGFSSIASAPFPVFRPVRAVSTLYAYACAVTVDSAAYCWGGVSQGAGTLVPVRVSAAFKFASVDVGGSSACGLTGAGKAYCWGLPNGTALPVGIAQPLAALTVGNSAACALTTSGVAYCWGYNSYGQVGNGTRSPVVGPSAPTPVAGGLTFQSINAGDNHVCGVSVDGASYCWGRNDRGQLGNGTYVDTTLPVAVVAPVSFLAVATGASSTCGLTAAGATYCWGFALQGSVSYWLPSPFNSIGGKPFSSLSARGSTHMCALTAAAAAWCWGDNAYGELGTSIPTTLGVASTSSPVAVSGGARYASIAAGGSHTCAVTTAGLAQCWGFGAGGVLGDGATVIRATPAPVRIF